MSYRLRNAVVVPVLGAALAAFALLAARDASSADGKQAQPSRVERGAYLAAIAGCHDCHTPGFFYGSPDMTRQLSGSELGWQGPWGVTYPLNLTPDPETGLGKWTDAQIVRALRTGVRPDGSVLRPPMPWQNFARLSDEDAAALVAYLRSIPPVKHQEPKAGAPGATASGPVLTLPPPPAWDAPRTPPRASGKKE